MNRYIVGSIWNRVNRNGINDNFQFLFQEQAKYANIRKEAEQVLSEAKSTNSKNEDVQQQIDNLILSDSESDAEVITARGDHDLLRHRFEEIEGKHEDNKHEVIQARGSHPLLKERFEEIEGKSADFYFSSNNSQPAKKGLLSNNYKVARKIDADNMEVFQKTSKGYLRYLFGKGTAYGGSGYGGNYDFLRVVKVEPINDVILFKSVANPKVGTVTDTFDWPSPHYNTLLAQFLRAQDRDINKVHHSDLPMTAYTISGSSSVTYSVPVTETKTINIAFFHRAAGSGTNDKVNIYINNRLEREISINDSFSQGIKRFDIPVHDSRLGDMDVKIENTSSNEVYIVGINVYKLDEYRGQATDSFVAIGSSLHDFITSPGASDYAFKNAENGKQFGSYHGGETSNRCDILWRSGSSDDSKYRSFNSIPDGDFCVTEFLSLKQITILIGRSYMHSKINWDTNGSLQMDFSYQVMPNFEAIPFIDFWTALTCTGPNFPIIRQPVYSNGAGESGHRYFKSTDGFVIQETTNGRQEIHIRFTRFNNEFVGVQEANSVSRAEPSYHKHYYAPIREWRDESKPIAPEVLQFSKGLDFYVY